MKTRSKGKLLSILLALCMVLALVPLSAQAAPEFTETADFTASDGGAAALAMLREAKTGTEDPSWDASGKILTLRGIRFATTATTALRLPAGTTLVLADGTENTVVSGDAQVEESGEEKNEVTITAVDALGDLTIQGGTAGTGTLSVTSGSHKNAGNGWTYASAISVYGDFTVKGGHVTAQGGLAEVTGDGGLAFSIGVNMDSDKRNKALLVTGGSLTAIAGEAYQYSDANDTESHEEFSRGVYMYRGSVTVSGDGKLVAQSVPEMAGAGLLSSGLYIYVGDLRIANEGELMASGAFGVDVSAGGIQMDGGRLTAVSTQTEGSYGNAIEVSKDTMINTENSANITVHGGTLETMNGDIYIAAYGAAETQGVVTVTGGTVVNSGRLEGAKKLQFSGGTVQTRSIEGKELTLSGDAALTIREPVQKYGYTGNLYVNPAISVSKLTVNGGTLDAAWDWGEYTPCVFPVDEYYGYATPLVKMPYETTEAAFNGGTTTLDTGCAGNTALLLGGRLTLGDGMEETGADAEHRQLGTDPVRFAAAERRPIDVVEINGVTVSFQDGDKPVFTGKVPEGTGYDGQCEWWELDSSTGVNSEALWDQSYENHITAFEKGRTYHYGLSLKAAQGYYFTADTKLKINGALYDYKRSESDPENGADRMNTMWVYTTLTMTPSVSGITPGQPEQPSQPGQTDPGKPETGKSPQTGDGSQLTLWVGLLLVGALGTAEVTLHKRRKAQRQ